MDDWEAFNIVDHALDMVLFNNPDITEEQFKGCLETYLKKWC